MQMDPEILSANGRDYILEELAILEGCIAQGLAFSESSAPTQPNQQKQPLFIVYPGEEEDAFIEGKKLLEAEFDTDETRFKFDVQWLEISIHEEKQQINKNIEGNINTPQRARFVKQKLVEILLQSNTKHLLFLISIGKRYHEDNHLEATVNLFANLVRGCVALLNEVNEEKSNAQSDEHKKRLENIKGDWNITVVAADTLQVYNNANTEEEKASTIKEYKNKGEKWIESAVPVFQRLTAATAKPIKLTINFVNWDILLNQAKDQYDFHAKYNYLLKKYQDNIAFKEAILVKGLSHKIRQLKKEIENNISHEQRDKKQKDISTIELCLTRLRNKNNPQSVSKLLVEPTNQHSSSPSIKPKEPENQLIGFSDKAKANDDLHLKNQNWLIKCIIYKLNHNCEQAISDVNKGRYNLPHYDEKLAVNRDDLFGQLDHHFQASFNSQKSNIVVCSGMGGNGKSHLATSYLHHTKYPYSFRAWINAASFDAEFIQLGQSLNLFDKNIRKKDEKETAMLKIKKWLENNEGMRLLIVDDVYDYPAIEKYLPQKNCHIILTSRKSNFSKESFNMIEVDTMTKEKSIELLKRYRDKTERSDDQFFLLAKELGYLPLALTMIGAYLKQYPELSIENCLIDIKEKFGKLMGNDNLVTGKNKHKLTVIAVLQNSINKILGEDKMKKQISLVEEVLNICAYLAPYHIPLAMLNDWFNFEYAEEIKKEPGLWDRIINQLLDHSLIKRDTENQFLTIHNVLQDVIRSKYNQPLQRNEHKNKAIKSKTQEAYLLIAAKILINSYSTYKILLKPHLEVILGHLDKYLEILDSSENKEFKELFITLKNDVLLNILHYLADTITYFEPETTIKKIKLLKRALKIEEQRDIINHIRICETLDKLINAYSELIQLKKAYYSFNQQESFISLCNETIKALEVQNERELGLLVDRLQGMGNCYGILKDKQRLNKFFDRKLTLREKFDIKDDIDLAVELFILGDLNLLDYKVIAHSYLLRAYNIFLMHPNFGVGHDITQEVRIRLMKILIGTQIVSLHPEILASRFLEQGNLGLAIFYYNEALRSNSLKEDTAHIIIQNLACLYHVDDRYDLARLYFEQALRIKKCASSYCDFALLYITQQRLEVALYSLVAAIVLANDGSGLFYGILEKKLLDKYLQKEINDDHRLEIAPIFLAFYWIIDCLQKLKEVSLSNFHLEKFVNLVEKYPTALHYRLLSYAMYKLGHKETSIYESRALSLQTMTEPSLSFNDLNIDTFYLKDLINIVQKSPSYIGYNLLSSAFSAKGDNERSEEYLATALSLEPSPEKKSSCIEQNDSDPTNKNELSISQKQTLIPTFPLKLIDDHNTIILVPENYDKKLLKTAEIGTPEDIEECLSHGAGLNAVDENELTVLLRAVLGGNLRVIQWLDKEKNVSFVNKDNNGNTPLILAVIYGHLQIIKWLVDKNYCCIQEMNKFGNTTLHFATELGAPEEIIEYLLQNGADINMKNTLGITPIGRAARVGNLRAVKYLHKKNADIYYQNAESITALMLAELNGRKEVVEYFNSLGCQIPPRIVTLMRTKLEELYNNAVILCKKYHYLSGLLLLYKLQIYMPDYQNTQNLSDTAELSLTLEEKQYYEKSIQTFSNYDIALTKIITEPTFIEYDSLKPFVSRTLNMVGLFKAPLTNYENKVLPIQPQQESQLINQKLS